MKDKVLGYFIKHPKKIRNYSHIPGEVFGKDAKVWDIIQRTKNPNAEKILNNLILENLPVVTPADIDIDYYISSLLSDYIKTKIKKEEEALHNKKINVDEFLDNISKLRVYQNPSLGENILSPEEMMDSYQSNQKKLSTLQSSGKLIQIPIGGFPWPVHFGGQMIVVAADPGIGKTAFLETIEARWIEHLKIIRVDNELAPESIEQRYIQKYSGVSQEDQSKPNTLTIEQKKLIEQARLKYLSLYNKDNHKMIYARTLDIDALVSKITYASEDFNPDVILLDQLNRIQRTNGNTTSNFENWIVKLKDMAVNLKAVIVVAAQFTKESQGQEFRTLADVFGTSEVNNNANLGITLYRQIDEFDGTVSSTGKGYVVKNNAGQLGSVDLVYVGKYLAYMSQKAYGEMK